jgi:hypothetical protein
MWNPPRDCHHNFKIMNLQRGRELLGDTEHGHPEELHTYIDMD